MNGATNNQEKREIQDHRHEVYVSISAFQRLLKKRNTIYCKRETLIPLNQNVLRFPETHQQIFAVISHEANLG